MAVLLFYSHAIAMRVLAGLNCETNLLQEIPALFPPAQPRRSLPLGLRRPRKEFVHILALSPAPSWRLALRSGCGLRGAHFSIRMKPCISLPPISLPWQPLIAPVSTPRTRLFC